MNRSRRAPSLIGPAFVLAAAVAALAIFPLYWALVSALRPSEDIFRFMAPLNLWTFIPNHITLQNMIGIWSTPFALAMLNSVLVTAGVVVLGLIICAMAAFPLAKLNLPGGRLIFSVVIVSFLIPFDAISIPLATLFRGAGLQNTYAGLILPGIGNGFAVFLLRQFFLGVPAELSDAARMDGLGWFGIFWRIYLPLSRPALIGAGLILFTFQWQSFLWPLLIAPDPDYKVAAVAIAEYAGELSTDYGLMFTAAVFISVVPLVVLVVFQRYFTGSVATTGGK